MSDNSKPRGAAVGAANKAQAQQRMQGPPRGGPMGGFMRGMGGKPKDFKKSMRHLISYLQPHLYKIIFACILSIVATVLAVFGPRLIGLMFDEVFQYFNPAIGAIDFRQLSTYGITLILIYITSALSNYFQNFIMSGVGAKTGMSLRRDISTKISKLPLKHFDEQFTGDVLSRITNDVDSIGQALNQSLSSMVGSICTIVGMTIMMFTIDYRLPFIPLATIPFTACIVIVIVKVSQKYFKTNAASLGALNGHIEENYTAHTIVRAFNAVESGREKFNKNNDTLKSSALKSQFLSGLMMPLFMLVTNIAVILVCVIGGKMAIEKATTYGGALVTWGMVQSFLIYVRRFNQPISQIASIATTLQSVAASSERVFEFLNAPEQEIESNTQNPPQSVKGEVEFKNVNFGYSPDKQIIFDFNMKVDAGSKVAIVGPTGAGKTTIVNLLMRFYEMTSGEILIDGVSTKDLKREEVRKYFGMVLQDTWLFEGTIFENIAFSMENVTFEEVKRACEAANIDHYIRTLPQGYQTVLSEENSLSAGQRQLLTIARCMVQNSPMLILDEATSNVDTRTEILIQEAMDRLTKGRTSFVIAHRLSTIKNADIILVMKDGNIIETGKHEELLEKQGFYANLYNSQFSEEQE